MSGHTPTPAQISVALQALRDDAERWSRNATTLEEVSAHVAAAALDPGVFSTLGGDLARAYTALHDRLATLLRAATANSVAVASALHESADTYESEERANVHRLRHVY